jgi:carboxyl-terminal processing protease
LKKHTLLGALALAVSLHATIVTAAVAVKPVGPAAVVELKPSASQASAALWSAKILSRYHYKPQEFNEALSARVFDRYIKDLDREKLFFVRSDIDQFAGERAKLGDAIGHERLTVPFAVYNLFMRRFEERIGYARSLLATVPDFAVDESVQIDREKAEWASTDAQIKDLWRKRVKSDWLRLKLAGKDAKAIRTTLDKRYDSYLRGARKTNSEDVFGIFMNAYAMTIEPHTNYLGPRSAEAFDVAMSLSVVGVGMLLQTREEYTVVREVLPGPAQQSKQFNVGDRILAIGQGTSGPMVDVVGWRLDDVVAKIRGTKGSSVRLDLLPASAGPDGKHLLVTLARQKVTLEESSAKKTLIDFNDGGVNRRVGVITLPSFYEDFEGRRNRDPAYKSATRDVARLIGELKKDKADVLLVDLRNNGGGSLKEAVDLTGLFIDKGPVVQQRNAEGKIQVESDEQGGRLWDKPVGVLINRGSASASEIFAAAIQDYGRGIIIGEPSFGKGTVQTLVDLNSVAGDPKAKLGELKMTVAQFFRINGGTTQLRGVTPDIKLPTLADSEEFGESSYDNALPWTSIKPAPFVAAGSVATIVPLLDRKHVQRVAKDQDFIYLEEDINELRKLRKDNVLSLKETVRRVERDKQEARAKLREDRLAGGADVKADAPALSAALDTAARKAAAAKPSAKPVKGAAANSRSDDGLQGDERTLASEIAAEAAAKNAKDILLNEAARVMADEIELLPRDKPAALAPPRG